MSLVSIIIPTHNRPIFLRKTILSILEQTYKNFELIVVSNGFNSTNKKVVQEFKDKRFIYREQKNSGGPASPRNHGIRLAKGNYVAFCDDDDPWMPEKLEKQIKALEENPKYGLCYSKMLRFNDIKEWANSAEEGPATLKSLLYVNTIPISSVLIRKSLIDKYGGFSESKSIGTAEDYEFLLRYAGFTKFCYLDEYLIKYWSGDNRTTFNSPNVSKLFKYYFQILACYYKVWKSGKINFTELLGPSLYNLNLTFKMFIYQFLVKLRIR